MRTIAFIVGFLLLQISTFAQERTIADILAQREQTRPVYEYKLVKGVFVKVAKS